MLRLLKWLIVAVVFCLGLVFAVMNYHVVEVDYGFARRELPLSMIMAIILAGGIVLGMLAALLATLPLRKENGRLRKQVRLAEQEVSNLRQIPMKDAL
jgi:putative membrane protein